MNPTAHCRLVQGLSLSCFVSWISNECKKDREWPLIVANVWRGRVLEIKYRVSVNVSVRRRKISELIWTPDPHPKKN